MLPEILDSVAKSYSQTRGRIIHYEIQPDGTIKREFIDPSDKSEKAWDLEQNTEQQISLKGYANSVKLEINKEETSVELVPSGRYQKFMDQQILSQALNAGGMMDSKKMMYLSMANLVMLFVFGIVGISMIT